MSLKLLLLILNPSFPPSPASPLSQQPLVLPGLEPLSEAPCDLGPHPASLQSGREQRSERGKWQRARGGTGLGLPLAWTGLGMCPGPSPVT